MNQTRPTHDAGVSDATEQPECEREMGNDVVWHLVEFRLKTTNKNDKTPPVDGLLYSLPLITTDWILVKVKNASLTR